MNTLSLIATGLLAFTFGEIDLDGVKCPISGRAVTADASAAHNGGKVFFCCGNCLAKFNEDSAPFAPKANAQLVMTGQATQKACPISGRPTDETKTTKVAGTKVAFCCANCLGKVNDAEGDEQIKLVFASEAFKKAFEVKKDDE